MFNLIQNKNSNSFIIVKDKYMFEYLNNFHFNIVLENKTRKEINEYLINEDSYIEEHVIYND